MDHAYLQGAYLVDQWRAVRSGKTCPADLTLSNSLQNVWGYHLCSFHFVIFSLNHFYL